MSDPRMSMWSVLPPRDMECDVFATEIASWLSAVLDRPVSSDLLHELADGTILCDLFVKLCPDTPIGRYKRSPKLEMQKRDNIQIFGKACNAYGVPKSATMNYSYFESKSIAFVITSLLVFVKVLIEKIGMERSMIPPSFTSKICKEYMENRILHKRASNNESAKAGASAQKAAESVDMSKEELKVLEEQLKGQVEDMLEDILNERRRTFGLSDKLSDHRDGKTYEGVPEEDESDSFDEKYVPHGKKGEGEEEEGEEGEEELRESEEKERELEEVERERMERERREREKEKEVKEKEKEKEKMERELKEKEEKEKEREEKERKRKEKEEKERRKSNKEREIWERLEKEERERKEMERKREEKEKEKKVEEEKKRNENEMERRKREIERMEKECAEIEKRKQRIMEMMEREKEIVERAKNGNNEISPNEEPLNRKKEGDEKPIGSRAPNAEPKGANPVMQCMQAQMAELETESADDEYEEEEKPHPEKKEKSSSRGFWWKTTLLAAAATAIVVAKAMKK